MLALHIFSYPSTAKFCLQIIFLKVLEPAVLSGRWFAREGKVFQYFLIKQAAKESVVIVIAGAITCVFQFLSRNYLDYIFPELGTFGIF